METKRWTTNNKWTQEEEGRALSLHQKRLPLREITERINREFGRKRTVKAVSIRMAPSHPSHRARQRLPLLNKTTPKQESQKQSSADFVQRVAEIVTDDKKRPKDYSLDEMANAFISAQQVLDDQSISQNSANVTIPAKVPIGLSFISDVHLGSPATNYQAFFADITRISQDPRLYLGKGGDWCDMFMGSFTDASAAAHQLQPPDIQIGFEDNIVKKLGDSIIAMIGGNHDSMATRKTGISHHDLLRRGDRFAFLPQGGLVNLTVGKITYRILWKHSYRFNSSHNEFNSHHRMAQFLAQCDVRVLEHLHSPGTETVEELEFDQKHTVVNIKTGTYKEEDGYSMSKWKAGRRGPQTIVLYPDRKKIVPFHGAEALEDAQTYMAGLG